MTAAAGRAAPFPWREAMAFGLGRLRLPPDAFWRMTPLELAAALAAKIPAGAGPPDLAGLMAAFPDGAHLP